MSVFYELNLKKPYKDYKPSEEVVIKVMYYFKGKKLTNSTGVSVKKKDFDRKWRERISKEPIKSTDKDYKEKNLKIKEKLNLWSGKRKYQTL